MENEGNEVKTGEEQATIVGPGNPPSSPETQFQPGQSGNPNGRPKGTKNLASIVRELEAEDFDWSKVPTIQADAIKQLGSPWRAITYAAVGRAIDGDIKAAEWLRKAGYGDRLDLTTDGEKITKVQVEVITNVITENADNQGVSNEPGSDEENSS